MPIPVACQCGRSYTLKDEFAGKLVKCPRCGASIQVRNRQVNSTQRSDRPLNQSVAQGISRQPSRGSSIDPVFNRDKFLLRQKVLTISEKYDVWDEQGQSILYIERPAHLLRNVGAISAGIVAGLLVFVIFFILGINAPDALAGWLIFLAVVGGGVVTIIVGFLLYQKRHITIYRDQSKQERLLEILQDKKIEILVATFTIKDARGHLLATLRKNYVYDIFRKNWKCYAPNGSLLCVAKEDSIILSLLRRFLGPFFGLLRANFIILERNTDRVIGEFNRKFTLLDRYVLDMSADRSRSLDRRIAIALGVMLDTGERR